MTTTVETPGFKPKKSVALSGVAAGNTALCTVGRTGNDLHYRGYDILDIAEVCEFEEIAHLLVHGKLPTRAELRAYKSKLKALRGLPMSVKQALEQLPAASHPMDVMRTGVSALGCVLPEKDDHNTPGARDIADRLMASLGSMLLYWYHWSTQGKRIAVETDDDSIGAHFLHLLHGQKPSAAWERAMHTSLNLYAEHEFNASTFTARVIAGTEHLPVRMGHQAVQPRGFLGKHGFHAHHHIVHGTRHGAQFRRAGFVYRKETALGNGLGLLHQIFAQQLHLGGIEEAGLVGEQRHHAHYLVRDHQGQHRQRGHRAGEQPGRQQHPTPSPPAALDATATAARLPWPARPRARRGGGRRRPASQPGSAGCAQSRSGPADPSGQGADGAAGRLGRTSGLERGAAL